MDATDIQNLIEERKALVQERDRINSKINAKTRDINEIIYGPNGEFDY